MKKTRERVKVVGHRGWPARFPDNCLAGIMAAGEVSDMVEIDLRLTADGVVVLSHDLELGGRLVGESRWSELEGVDLGGGHRPLRLADLLAQPRLVPGSIQQRLAVLRRLERRQLPRPASGRTRLAQPPR